MEKNISKWELWRNQTLVNRVRDNSTIAVEYYTLINYIVNEYKGRMETIQNPLLHLISHCVELSYKELIELAIRIGYIKINNEQQLHSHKLMSLLPVILKIYRNLASEQACPDSDRELFSKKFVDSNKSLVNILKTNTITYRYAFSRSRDKNKDIQYTADLFESDIDCPNIINVYKLFDTCYDSIAYSVYILDMMFPEFYYC